MIIFLPLKILKAEIKNSPVKEKKYQIENISYIALKGSDIYC